MSLLQSHLRAAARLHSSHQPCPLPRSGLPLVLLTLLQHHLSGLYLHPFIHSPHASHSQQKALSVSFIFDFLIILTFWFSIVDCLSCFSYPFMCSSFLLPIGVFSFSSSNLLGYSCMCGSVWFASQQWSLPRPRASLFDVGFFAGRRVLFVQRGGSGACLQLHQLQLPHA